VIELYHGDFQEFSIQDCEVDIILVDPFPGTERVSSTRYARSFAKNTQRFKWSTFKEKQSKGAPHKGLAQPQQAALQTAKRISGLSRCKEELELAF